MEPIMVRMVNGKRSKPKMLDLFSGTGSVGHVYRNKGFEVVSLDSDPTVKADIQKMFWNGSIGKNTNRVSFKPLRRECRARSSVKH